MLFLGVVTTLFGQQTPQVVSLADLNTSQVVLEAVAGGAGQTGSVALFRGTDGEHGDEVWIVQGGAARLAQDVRPGPESSDPGGFAPLGNAHFTCVADDGVTGPEVRVFDANGELISGGWALTDLRPSADHTAPVLLGSGNGIVWYAMDDVDAGGDASQSVWAFSANQPPQRVGSYQRGTLQQASVIPGTSRLCFIARAHNEDDLRICMVDGTQQALKCGSMGTAAEAEPLPQPAYAATSAFVCFRQVYGSASLRSFHFASFQNHLLQALGPSVTPWPASNGTDRVCFAGYNPNSGIELWTTQGTPATTQLVSDLSPGAANSRPSRIQMEAGGQGVFFQTGTEGGSRSLYYASRTFDSPTFQLLSSQAHLGNNFTIVSGHEMAFTAPGGAGSRLWLANGNSGALSQLDDGAAIHRLWRPAAASSPTRGLNWLTETSMEYRIRVLGSGSQTATVRSFAKPPSGGHLPVAFLGAPANQVYVVGADHDQQRRLWWFDGTFMSSAQFIQLQTTSEYPTASASSHPADFFEIDGQLVLSAIPNGGRRVLYFSHTGEPESFQVVGDLAGDLNLPGADDVDQVVKLGSRLFFTGMAPGQSGGALRLFRARYAPAEASNGGVISEAVTESAMPVEAQRLVVAAGKVFLVNPGTTTDTLRCVDASLNLVTVGVFAKDSLGEGIADLVGSPDLLFFSAVATSGPSAGQRTVWSTAGVAGVPAAQPPRPLASARPLGLLGTHVVFWNQDGPNFREWTWSGNEAEGPAFVLQGPLQEQPVRSRDWRRPSGIENEGRFYSCNQLGKLVWFNTSGQYGVFYDDAQVLPEHLSSLGGQLVFHALRRDEVDWFTFRWAGGTHDPLLGPGHLQRPGPMFQHGGQMWFSRFGQGNPPNTTELRSSDGLVVSNQAPMFSARRATAMSAAGSFRGHLFLAAGAGSGHYGTEPCILNTSPEVPIPPLLQGARKEQPFAFTYAQLITGTASDADGDTVSSPAITPPFVGVLKRNGAVVSAEIPILPGDTFEWTPTADPIGNVEVVYLVHRDPWSTTETPVLIRVETPHDEWTRLHFTPQQLADPLVSGPAADADGDGVSNALEFVFGRLPHQREGERGWSLTSTTPAAGQRRAVFTFNRLAVLPLGTAVLIEQSEDLQSWNPVAIKVIDAAWHFPVAGVTVEEVTLPDGRIETRVSVEESASLNRFLRLRLVLP